MLILSLFAALAGLAAGIPAASLPPQYADFRPVVPKWKSRHTEVNQTQLGLLPFVPGNERVSGCGVKRGASTRVVGGTEVVPHSYPWQVALFIDFVSFCGGSIISKDWVLTAAHCIDRAHEVQVVMGAHNIQEGEMTQLQWYSKQWHVHPYWNYPSYLNNDIALIKLPRSVTFSDAIRPVCLPSRSAADLAAGEWVTVTGWGMMYDGSYVVDKLREVTVPVATQAACEQEHGTYTATENIVCIDTTGVRGACNGDSGGPLNYIGLDGRTYTRGITSFVSYYGCESQRPEGFTRVSHYLDWIETTTGIIIDN